MSGYRVMAGIGKLSGASRDKPDELPKNSNGSELPIYSKDATKNETTKTDCLHQLTSRIGAGVTMSLTRTRNMNYVQEMGLREFTTATSGNYEVDFSFEGIFSPKLCEKWLAYAFMMGDENTTDTFELKSTNINSIKCYTTLSADTEYTSKESTTVYPKLVVGSVSSKIGATAIKYSDLYTDKTTGNIVVTYSYYTDADATKEYTGSNKTQNVYVKAVIKYGSIPTEVSLTTTSAIAFGEATSLEVVKYYTDAEGNKEFTPNDADVAVYLGYVDTTTTNKVVFGQPVLYRDFTYYKSFIGNDSTKSIKLFGYKNLTGPKYFDLGYQKINAHASGVTKYDGLNEMGVLLGCAINSASMSYESGSDAGVKFSISGHALRDVVYMTQEAFDYASILDEVPTEVFVGGCVSVYNPDTDSYEAIAQTDSASISITNNLQKLGNCLKLNYSSYAMGALNYEVSTSTYSNDPNKYLKYLYGYSADLVAGKNYFIGKAPVAIGHMKIRTDDTSAVKATATEFMDINMTDTFVGDMSQSYSVDSAIMDEPSLRPKKVYIAVGYTSS